MISLNHLLEPEDEPTAFTDNQFAAFQDQDQPKSLTPNPDSKLGIAEQAIVSQYEATLEAIEDNDRATHVLVEQRKALRVQEAHLYKLASVINPSLKRTRPKS